MDNRLVFDKQIVNLKKKCFHTLRNIRKIRFLLSQNQSLVSEASQWWLQRSTTVCQLPSHQQNPWNPSKHFLKVFYSNCLCMNLKKFINDCFCPIFSVGSLILSFTQILV